MEDEIPPWLNTEFLEKVLQEGENDKCKIHVVNFSAKAALPPGNNYTSHMIRVKVEYTEDDSGMEKEVSIMVKAPITKGIINDMQDRMDMFAAEPRVYHELLPRMKEKIPCDFGPKSYPCPIRGLVLKDLKNDGYAMGDRLKQLDFSHCKLALSSLAKFHAASVACYHDDPDFIRNIGEERIYNENGFLDDIRLWFTTVLKTVGDMIKEVEECQEAANYILEKSETMMKSLVDICKPRHGKLNVINHGDFWMNNMLFRYDAQGEVVDVKFVDYQVVRYASPVLDLLYFLYTSADEESRSRQKELFDAYLQTLNSCLKSLGCEERLSSEQLEEELRSCTEWAVVTICNVLPIVLCDPENVLNMEEFNEEDFQQKQSFDKFLKIYKSKGYLCALPKVIKHFQEQFFC